MSDHATQLRALWADLPAKVAGVPEGRISVLAEAADALDAQAATIATLTAERDEARKERDALRADRGRWSTVGGNAAAQARTLTAERDALAAELREIADLLPGDGSVGERVRALLPKLRVVPTVTYVLGIGRDAPLSEWFKRSADLDDGAAYVAALLDEVAYGSPPCQHTEDSDAVADIRRVMGDLVSITEIPYTDECAF